MKEDVKKLAWLASFVGLARQELGDISLSQLAVLLKIMSNEGITQPELMDQFNIHQGSLSRIVGKLGYYMARRSDGGFDRRGRGLVENRMDTRIDTRRNAVFLTEKGKQLRDLFFSTFKQLE